MKCWLGRKIPYWKYVDDKLTTVELQHCLYCRNGGMSIEEKKKLRSEFIIKSLKKPQRLFHLNRVPTIEELHEFIAMTSELDERNQKSRKCNKHGATVQTNKCDNKSIVYNEDESNSPNRVFVLEDLMSEAFNSKNKQVSQAMDLLMTKLSHHNNVSVLTVCHELYPKRPNSVLMREQLTGVHIHLVANSQKPRNL